MRVSAVCLEIDVSVLGVINILDCLLYIMIENDKKFQGIDSC